MPHSKGLKVEGDYEETMSGRDEWWWIVDANGRTVASDVDPDYMHKFAACDQMLEALERAKKCLWTQCLDHGDTYDIITAAIAAAKGEK